MPRFWHLRNAFWRWWYRRDDGMKIPFLGPIIVGIAIGVAIGVGYPDYWGLPAMVAARLG